MSLKLAETMEAVPDEVKKFVVQKDDGIYLDNEGIMKGLKAERAVSDGLRQKLSAFTESGLDAAQIKAFAALGKTPEELAAALSAKPQAASGVTTGIDPTEYAKLKKAAEKAESLVAELNAAKAENARSKCRELARKAVEGMPDKYDRERIGKFVETFVADKLALDASGTGLAAVDGELFPDYIAKIADSMGFVRTSTAGIARPGSSTAVNAGGAYAAAKSSGDIAGMIAAAPEVK